MSASEDLSRLLGRMTAAAEAGDGKAFAACFTADGVYHDYIYGDHRGRAEIAHMMEDLFHRDATEYRWQFFDAVSDGRIGYAWSLSTFVSKVPEFKGKRVVIDGMSRFELEGGLIRDYSESVNGGVAMVQLGVAPARMEKVLRKWSGWLQERPATKRYLGKG
ncbi:MAG TPA: nuclear transport factor 2 family protein [Candidatus Cybelea sp.]|nr:nuclear transport factor 2 family protein [Candidatus Cybelea sp.]